MQIKIFFSEEKEYSISVDWDDFRRTHIDEWREYKETMGLDDEITEDDIADFVDEITLSRGVDAIDKWRTSEQIEDTYHFSLERVRVS